MTPIALLVALLNSSGTILPLVTKLIEDIRTGKGEQPITEADWAALVALASQSSADIYKREGIVPPPSVP